ncbi:uncharacterized protein PgNI_05070 [Pyricularia grisea]|uniref:Uncharacterized protein n=1 Tax=Pyricularia grisea TaxID=148305 RepID=A0A6P8BE04_PYRGI|nr:uncharacterized protein PgNI_05070 [Pyricularia grisea]TLD13932.1 hypothetical protein PgNI_05070 [Pyricularia grisea]
MSSTAFRKQMPQGTSHAGFSMTVTAWARRANNIQLHSPTMRISNFGNRHLTGRSPGADRIIFSSATEKCDYAGFITHRNAVGNSFTECKVYGHA